MSQTKGISYFSCFFSCFDSVDTLMKCGDIPEIIQLIRAGLYIGACVPIDFIEKTNVPQGYALSPTYIFNCDRLFSQYSRDI